LTSNSYLKLSPSLEGVGFDLLCHFLQMIRPSNLIILQENERSGLAESLQQAMMIQERNEPDKNGQEEKMENSMPNILLHLQSVLEEEQVSRRIKLNAADQRSLNLISYFMRAPASTKGQTWDFSTPLTARLPYTVPLSAISLKFLNTQVPFSQVFYALNGSIVGLVVDATTYHPHPAVESSFEPDMGLAMESAMGSAMGSATEPAMGSAAGTSAICKIVPTHTPLRQSNCLGLGLVRAIDLSSNTLYLLTPVPLSMMSRVSLLVRGSSALECPVALLTHTAAVSLESSIGQKHKGGSGRKDVMGVPYTTSLGAEGVGSTEFKTRHLGRKRLN
jgi:polynucleotide 5'-hydroxyl-kinase GRC3/NOL9